MRPIIVFIMLGLCVINSIQGKGGSDGNLEALVSQLVEKVTGIESQMIVKNKQIVHLTDEVKQLKKTNRNLANNLTAMKSEFQAYMKDVQAVNMADTHQRNGNQRITPRANCTLGSQFRFREHLNSIGIGSNLPLDAEGSQNECLYLCLITPNCEGVTMSTEEGTGFTCLGLTGYSGTNPSVGLNYYELIGAQDCIVGLPQVAFQAKMSNEPICMNAGDTFIWDFMIGNTTNDLKANGHFHCPVTGVYQFYLALRSSNTNLHAAGDLRTGLNGDVGRLSLYNGQDSGFNSFYYKCTVGEDVWVVNHEYACYYSTYYAETSFAATLLMLM